MSFIQLRSPPEGSSDDTLTVIVNVVSEIEANQYEISIKAKLDKYPYAAAGIANFQLNILAAG